MADDERLPIPEPPPYEPPTITDLELRDGPLETAPGFNQVSDGGGGIG